MDLPQIISGDKHGDECNHCMHATICEDSNYYNCAIASHYNNWARMPFGSILAPNEEGKCDCYTHGNPYRF